MSAVTLLAVADQDDSGAGAAVNVSAFSTLRLNFFVQADLGRVPQIHLEIQDAPSASGPWRAVWAKDMSAGTPSGNTTSWDGAPRAILSSFQEFIRLTWWGNGNANMGTEFRTARSAKFRIGLTGDGQPDA